MSNFFKKKATQRNKIKNPFAPKPNYGGGQSLGGTKPGSVLQITLSEPGPLGVQVEKRPGQKTAIIAQVVPSTQADRAGLMRGDVVCRKGSQGQDEILYKDFLQMAASDVRPLEFEVRRIETSNASNNATNTSKSADSEARKRAVIAAAEQRANKTTTKPIKKKDFPVMLSTAERKRLEKERLEKQDALQEEPLSVEAQKAVAQAKRQEEVVANELGYNPYQTKRATAGQARTATVAMTHGAIQGGGDSSVAAPSQAQPAAVAPPPAPTAAVLEEDVPPVSEAFQEAFTTLVTSGTDESAVQSSLQIMQTLITNATTKGLAEEEGEKYRRVRLANAKIAAAITSCPGALEIMLAVGFELTEQDGETLLRYPFPVAYPPWLPRALQSMKEYNTTRNV